MAFANMQKAFFILLFHEIKRCSNALVQHSIPGKVINVLKEAYKNETAQIKAKKLSRKISMMKGVPQGDTLSNCVYSQSRRNLKENK